MFCKSLNIPSQSLSTEVVLVDEQLQWIAVFIFQRLLENFVFCYLQIFFKMPDTMFSFDGQYKSRRAVSLGGASEKVTFLFVL